MLDVQLRGLPFATSIDWDATGLVLHGGVRPLVLVTSRKQNQATSFRLQAANDQLHYFVCLHCVNERAQVLDWLRTDMAKAILDLFADVRPGERPLGLHDLADRFAQYLLLHDPGPLHLRHLAATAIMRADLAKWKELFPLRAVPVPVRATADQVAPPPWPKVPTPHAALMRFMDVVSAVIQSELRLPHVRDLVKDVPLRPWAPPRHDREPRTAHEPGQITVIHRAPCYSVAPRCVQCGEKEARHARPMCEAWLAAHCHVMDILRGADLSNLLGWSGGGG
ncbi:hypothetical protein AMAG_12218 [Allomyces macrogynus ATCC 38327]|uniref:Uncharacterized protein n=1 Tax=Allomyces macrogynus (strain ATCC 38327) TaxID=578462 RepID=A0A0L0SXB6_ALLM3|nr:hypothetical protein AMAG_12218 [Allomyces macrogynus ATCC 38327]|eukprot:KNE67147.1 hypothetical protein AMAG_12218 [Allomyces macrogynus ATCC 38327]